MDDYLSIRVRMDDYLSKPIKSKDLAEKLTYWLDR